MKYLLIIGAILLIGCPQQDPVEPPLRLVTATPMIEMNPETPWVEYFLYHLGGSLGPVRIYPASALGTEVERAEHLILGLAHIGLSNGAVELNYSPRLRTLRLPFLFDSTAQMDCLLHETPFLDEVDRESGPRGLKILDVIFMGGPAGLFTSGEIPVDPAAIRHLRIRAMDRIQVRTVSSWNASPVQVSWEEIQTAMQTGVVDGYLNPPGIALQFNHTRQLAQFIDLRIFMGFRFVTVSQRWFDDLSGSQRAALLAAVAAARHDNRVRSVTQMQEDLAGLAEAGISVVSPTHAERAAFAVQARKAWPEIAGSADLSATQSLLLKHCSAGETEL